MTLGSALSDLGGRIGGLPEDFVDLMEMLASHPELLGVAKQMAPLAKLGLPAGFITDAAGGLRVLAAAYQSAPAVAAA